MIAAAVCEAIAVNGTYAAAGTVAAARYGMPVTVLRGAGLLLLLAGTALECSIVSFGSGVLASAFIPAFGAVVTGAAFDAACGYVFDAVTAPALALIALAAIAGESSAGTLMGAAAAGSALGMLYAITRGRGLGLGDVKLAACLGAGTGVSGGLEALGVAFVAGGAYAAFLLLTKRASRGDEMRFAPFMAGGMAVVMAARVVS